MTLPPKHGSTGPHSSNGFLAGRPGFERRPSPAASLTSRATAPRTSSVRHSSSGVRRYGPVVDDDRLGAADAARGRLKASL